MISYLKILGWNPNKKRSGFPKRFFYLLYFYFLSVAMTNFKLFLTPI